MTLFVDTSVWYAAADTGDRNNARAKEIIAEGEALVTSDHVLLESWTLLRNRLNRHAANRFWDGIHTGIASVEPVGLADLEVGRGIRDRFEDQDFSFVDLTSFAVMHRLGLERVAAFDADFAIYRFGPERDRAFTVIR